MAPLIRDVAKCLLVLLLWALYFAFCYAPEGAPFIYVTF